MTQSQVILVTVYILTTIALGETSVSTDEWIALSLPQRVFVIICFLFWPVTFLVFAIWYFFFYKKD